MSTRNLSIAFAATALFALGCGQPSTGGSATTEKKSGEVIASVGGSTITVDDFKAKLDEQSPFIRARYTTLERKKEFLDNLIRFEVLAQEAQRQGLDKDPEVQAALKKMMVQRLIRKEFDEKNGKEFADADLKKYYDEHLDEFVKPERVRVSHIFIPAPEGAARAKVKSEVAKLLTEVKGKESGPEKTAFTEVAKVRSEDAATKASGGDLSFKTKEELAAAWGPKFAEAAVNMKAIGEIGDLVETDKGFHLIKLTGRQNAVDRPFDTVKAQIQNRLARDSRTKAFDDFVADLRTKANVQVKDDVLDKIEVVPAGQNGGVVSGMGAPEGSQLPPGQPPAMPAMHPGSPSAPPAMHPGMAPDMARPMPALPAGALKKPEGAAVPAPAHK